MYFVMYSGKMPVLLLLISPIVVVDYSGQFNLVYNRNAIVELYFIVRTNIIYCSSVFTNLIGYSGRHAGK